MRMLLRRMSKRERRFNSLAGVALLVCFMAYGVHFVAPESFATALAVIWMAGLSLAVAFEAISRVFHRRDLMRPEEP